MSRATNAPSDLDVELRLAAIHVRLGSLLLARAELESLATRELLAADGLADLAELRWRAGDLEGAGTAAAAHLAAGGNQPIARVVLAESDASAGRPDEAENHVETLRDLGQDDLVTLVAGMPLRGPWPTLGSNAAADPREAASPFPEEDQGPGAGTGGQIPLPLPDARDVLARAAVDLRSRDRLRHGQGMDRLALVLRLDPSLAAEVVEILERRREAAANLTRGDALRILGRGRESEAAYGAAAAALESSPDRPT